MTTSRSNRGEAFVWIWLPGTTDPVVAGKLTADGEDLIFNYGQSYPSRDDAISIHETELLLRSGALPLVAGLHVPNCIRDAAPDTWGRRVIMNKVLGTSSPHVDTAELDELTYLLESGSDRIGALDFQRSPTEYVPRLKAGSTLEKNLGSTSPSSRRVRISTAW